MRPNGAQKQSLGLSYSNCHLHAVTLGGCKLALCPRIITLCMVTAAIHSGQGPHLRSRVFQKVGEIQDLAVIFAVLVYIM